MNLKIEQLLKALDNCGIEYNFSAKGMVCTDTGWRGPYSTLILFDDENEEVSFRLDENGNFVKDVNELPLMKM